MTSNFEENSLKKEGQTWSAIVRPARSFASFRPARSFAFIQKVIIQLKMEPTKMNILQSHVQLIFSQQNYSKVVELYILEKLTIFGPTICDHFSKTLLACANYNT